MYMNKFFEGFITPREGDLTVLQSAPFHEFIIYTESSQVRQNDLGRLRIGVRISLNMVNNSCVCFYQRPDMNF